MFDKIINHVFMIYNKEFKSSKSEAYEVVLLIAIGHFLKVFNVKQFSDYLGIDFRSIYSKLKDLSVYKVKAMLQRLMLETAVGELKVIMDKSSATISRANISFSVDNSVIDRFGKTIRCTWSWYSGNCKKVVNGQDLLGIVLSLNGKTYPLSLRYCSKQGRSNTNKPDMLITMFKELKELFDSHDIDITTIAITMDSWFASSDQRNNLHELGFTKIIVAGKGNYVFEVNGIKANSSQWKKELQYSDNNWGINVPSVRLSAKNKTFGKVILLFFKHSRSRNYYLMNFSKTSLRGVEIWHIWKQHHVIENFWKQLKSVFKIKDMRMQKQGLYTALLIKVLAYIMAMLLKTEKQFLKLSLFEIMKNIFSINNLSDIANKHFHLHKLLKLKLLTI